MAGPHGKDSVMDRTVCCREGSIISERFDCLADVYRCFLTGSCPSQRAADVADVIFSGVCAAVHDEDRVCVAAEDTVKLTCISLTLVEKISSSQNQPPQVTSYCTEILRRLFQDLDIMSQLLHHFQTDDQIISHLAAKSVSASVSYHIQKSGTVNPVWQQTCVQVFHSSPPGSELDACVWSLTEVLKRLLKGAHQEILGNLVAAFDSSLCSLSSKFLPERKTLTQSLVDFTASRLWKTTFCLLLDLLEVLTASSLMPGAGVCLMSQRITHLHSSALLSTVGCTSEYFVKKRALLLLKRAVLQQAGDDWALGEVVSSSLKYEHFSSDMNMLAETVLAAVAANWLENVQVEFASFFGGTRHVTGDEDQKPDCVMLRAVSLLLLKSVELHVQTASGRAGANSASEVYGYLQRLWAFLGRCSVRVSASTHLCRWVSLVFAEQDDDMMEAAKAMLSIFLHHRLCSGLDDSAVLDAACASGCNSHCHFLLLLQSVSFDHSILLDFLISTETCFLEYFVRYLKYLTVDWQGFTATCGRISMSDSHLSMHESLTCSRHGDISACAYKDQPLTEEISLTTGPHLVEYDCSDESDQENMEISEDERGASVCLKQEATDPQMPIRQKQYASCDSTGLLSKPNPTLERQPRGLSLLLTAQQPNIAPLSGQMTRTVLCLSKLREVLTKLQTKKLFPYNPSSLLKLLAQVQECFQQSELSQFNK